MQTMSNNKPRTFCFLLVLMAFLSMGSAVENMGILHIVHTTILRSEKNTSEWDFCIMYNYKFSSLPETLEQSVMYGAATFYYGSNFCNNSADYQGTLQNQVAFVNTRNCTLSEKAYNVQSYGGAGLVVLSNTDISEPVAAKDEDYNLINIPVAMMSARDFLYFTSREPIGWMYTITVQIYSPPSPHVDWNLILIWLLAAGTVFAGAWWSGVARHREHKKKRRISDVREPSIDRDQDEGDEGADNFDMSPKTVIIFVIMMCGMLVALYFFYDYLVYVVIGMFALASSIALYSALKPLLLRITFIGDCRLPANRLPLLRRRPEIRRVILYLMCAGVAAWWVVIRNDRWAWILQDVLGVFFCVHMMKTIRLPSLMSCTILLLLMFVYDIFFVFITPLFTKSGESIMVDVATGSGSSSGEMLPMVLKVPRITASTLSICQFPDSLLGFGDILVPGLLVSYCHGFDLKVNSKKVYFICTMIAYGIGLVLTFIALALMQTGQPALLYLVPCTLLTTVVIAACRHELGHMWRGRLAKTPGDSSKKADVDSSRPSDSAGSGVNGQCQRDGVTGSIQDVTGSLQDEDEHEGSDCEQPLLLNN